MVNMRLLIIIILALVVLTAVKLLFAFSEVYKGNTLMNPKFIFIIGIIFTFIVVCLTQLHHICISQSDTCVSLTLLLYLVLGLNFYYVHSTNYW